MAGTASFVLPYLLLAAPAGYLADRFSKQRVIVACKLAEIAIMAIAITAILVGSVSLLLVVVALMGAQSALFGPAKLGSIPEMLNESRISAANGLIGLTTVISAAVGTAVGNWLATATGEMGTGAMVAFGDRTTGDCAGGLGCQLTDLAFASCKSAAQISLGRCAAKLFVTCANCFIAKIFFRVALGIMFFLVTCRVGTAKHRSVCRGGRHDASDTGDSAVDCISRRRRFGQRVGGRLVGRDVWNWASCRWVRVDWR